MNNIHTLNILSETHPQCNVNFLLGFVLERCHRKPRNGRRSAGAKHSLGYQFLGLSPKEALAERPLSVHQEHHGSCSTPLLN